MYQTALITDSSSDLPLSLVRDYAIQVVPLYIIWGTAELRDGIDITSEAFYRRLISDHNHPKTSQPAPADFSRAINAAAQAGAQQALILTLSGAMSGTLRAAEQGAREASIPVKVMDSYANSMSLGWEVLAAARTRQRGGDLDAMVASAIAVRSTLVTRVMVDTLEFLHKGGRINAVQRMIGSAINVKPQLFVDHATGEVKAGSRTRTRSKAIDELYRSFTAHMAVGRPLRVAVMHGDAQSDAQALAERIQNNLRPLEIIVGLTSAVLGVHTGPGALALCGYTE